MNLSVAIITKNEERIIEETITAVQNIADEIIVLDSFSTDKTEEICRKFQKVKFEQRQFNGFGEQKNHAITLCSGRWILFIDADEVLDEEAQKSVAEISIKENAPYKVYNIEWRNIILGKMPKHGGWGKVYRDRLFMRGFAQYTDDIVHESLDTKEKKGILKGRILHYTYKDIGHHIEKQNYYAFLMAEKLYAKGKTSGWLKIYFKPKFVFLKTYILRFGILDGYVGYYLAKTGAFYTFLKYSKLYEMNKVRVK